MRVKNVKSHLGKKFKEFVESIQDKDVRNLVEKNSIITGGCIVSLLTNEKVNDYDIYFQDRKTTLAVARYYVEKYKELNPDSEDVPVVGDIGERIKIYIQSNGVAYDSELMKEVKHFDHGYRTDEFEADLEAVINVAEQDIEGYRPIFLTCNAITLSNKVQLVIRFYGKPEEIHENYDFVHCTCYYLPAEHKLVLPAPALESILTKELRYMGSKYPICSVIRTRKFIKKGWMITGGQYLKMAYQISQLDLDNMTVLEDQLVGVDAYYFTQIIEILREKKEKDADFKLDENYLSTLIDRMF